MLAFLVSSIRFIGKVIKRSVFGIVLWVLDMADLYTRLIKPHLSEEWVNHLQPYAEGLNVATPFFIAGIVVWAILFTYYEVDKQIQRDSKVSKKLKEMYGVSGEFLRRPITDEAEVAKLNLDFIKWFKETQKWIEENMEPSTLTRFMYFQHSLPYNHANPFNEDHQKNLNGVNIYHKNLQAIVESQEWR